MQLLWQLKHLANPTVSAVLSFKDRSSPIHFTAVSFPLALGKMIMITEVPRAV